MWKNKIRTHLTREQFLDDFPVCRLGDFVVDGGIVVEVEWLECVKHEVAHVLVHVRVYYSTVEIVDHASAVHHLTGSRQWQL